MKFFSGKLTKPPCQLFCHWWILFLVLGCLDYGTATITLTSTLNGQSASPGQEVNYICTLTEAAVISWTFPPVSTDENCVQFTPTTPPDQRMLNSSDVPAINCADLNFWADLDFWAALTSVGTINMTNGLADLTSTLRFPATVALNEAVIQCSGLTRTSTEMANQTLIVEATPTSTGTRQYLPLWATVLAAVVTLALAKEK